MTDRRSHQRKGPVKLIVRSPLPKQPHVKAAKPNNGKTTTPNPEIAAMLAAMEAERR